jgi:hypothetical protein
MGLTHEKKHGIHYTPTRQLLDTTDESARRDLEVRLDQEVWQAFGVAPDTPSA